jgi:cellulose synthase/poly-beta-1,6-N-acetylglucosamine synthase-like glycosyltransferase
MIFDADNLLERDFVSRMNEAFAAGERIVTGYRNAKNPGKNWIAAGHTYFFLRECRFMHRGRQKLGASTFISGTGFLVDGKLVRDMGGWKYTSLTEDVEFSVSHFLRDIPVAYCQDAIFYDEQPENFKDSWNQRMRWCRGQYQCARKYGKKLYACLFRGDLRYFDYVMFLMPTPAIALGWYVFYFVFQAVVTVIFKLPFAPFLGTAILSLLGVVLVAYAVMLFNGALLVLCEHKRIRCSLIKQILYIFTLPIFMTTFVPIIYVALFKKVDWRPIRHTQALSIEDMEESVILEDKI